VIPAATIAALISESSTAVSRSVVAIEAWPGASLDRRVVVQVPVRPTKAGDTQASQRESGHYCDDYCYDHA
jgi:hypothetical protein